MSKQFLVTLDTSQFPEWTAEELHDAILDAVGFPLAIEARPELLQVRATDLTMSCTQCGWPVDTSVQPVFPDKFKHTEDSCPGHVQWVKDHRRCGRCGVHIESLRPPEEDDLPYENYGLEGF